MVAISLLIKILASQNLQIIYEIHFTVGETDSLENQSYVKFQDKVNIKIAFLTTIDSKSRVRIKKKSSTTS